MSALNLCIDKSGKVVPDLANLGFCSGFGQWHSPNNERDPKPYTHATMASIRAMLDTTPSVAKENAQWAIFSTLPSRVHAGQRGQGQFVALWADIDDNSAMNAEQVYNLLHALLPGFIVYTSRSATQENQKLRIIVPLTETVSGSTFVRLQKVLNNKLETVGITPDRVTERAGQVCYLPNKGEFWSWDEKQGALDPTLWADELAVIVKEEKAAQVALQQAREQSRLKAVQFVATGCKSPIDAFNREYPLDLMLRTFGYVQRGKRYVSPNSESGVPGVSITADGMKWISAHGSDRAIGKPTDTGSMGDAFDLFTYYQHGGNHKAAIKAAGEMFAIDGVSITKHNQCEFMVSHSDEKALAAFDDISEGAKNDPVFDLKKFSLTGQAENMRKQMLEDKYVLGKMAILGQSTVFYAPPNAGKTLLTLWLIIEGIKSGEINGRDVFYINADDNFKGVVHKLELAERYGFEMLVPGHNGFESDALHTYLSELVNQNNARGKIVILDTAKKFTDLMNKEKSSKFGACVRQFVSHGGTAIMLAHTNKHRDDENKVVYSGTTDLVDDADCAYTLDVVTEDKASGLRTVQFTNFKSRGNVTSEAVYRYDFAEGNTYRERLNSVEAVGQTERQEAEKRKRLDMVLDKNRNAVEIIKECIGEGIINKTELIQHAHERSSITKAKIRAALSDHTGSSISDNQFWHVNVKDKNAHVYQLNSEIL
ncbi:MAG: AAA family ATPase [Pseudomonadota bacterium]